MSTDLLQPEQSLDTGLGKQVSVNALILASSEDNLDLAIISAPSTVSILRGKGDGTFGPASYFGVGGGPFSVVAGDFSGETLPALAVANSSSNNITVLTNIAQ